MSNREQNHFSCSYQKTNFSFVAVEFLDELELLKRRSEDVSFSINDENSYIRDDNTETQTQVVEEGSGKYKINLYAGLLSEDMLKNKKNPESFFFNSRALSFLFVKSLEEMGTLENIYTPEQIKEINFSYLSSIWSYYQDLLVASFPFNFSNNKNIEV